MKFSSVVSATSDKVFLFTGKNEENAVCFLGKTNLLIWSKAGVVHVPTGV